MSEKKIEADDTINKRVLPDYKNWFCVKCGRVPTDVKDGKPYCKKHLLSYKPPRIRKPKLSGYSKRGIKGGYEKV